jgi:hypothetical protein
MPADLPQKLVRALRSLGGGSDRQAAPRRTVKVIEMEQIVARGGFRCGPSSQPPRRASPP